LPPMASTSTPLPAHTYHFLFIFIIKKLPPMASTPTPLPLQPNSTHGFNINTIAFTTKPRVQHCA
jgi:hypothetical protein